VHGPDAAARRLAGAVVYIDTEGKFSGPRLLQIVRARLAAHAGAPPSLGHVQALGKRVHIITPKSGARPQQDLP